jgi:hypothetical protein
MIVRRAGRANYPGWIRNVARRSPLGARERDGSKDGRRPQPDVPTRRAGCPTSKPWEGIDMIKTSLDHELFCAAVAIVSAAFITGFIKFLVG